MAESSVRRLIRFIAIVLLLASALAPSTRGAHAQDGTEITQRKFDRLIEQTAQSEPVFGPESGTLIYDEGYISLENANLDAADVLVMATFTNPSSSTRHSFDFGITIRERGNGISSRYLSFIVLESGIWALVDQDQDPLVQGEYDDFNGRREGQNTLTVYAEGNIVHLGINGDYVGSTETDIVRSGEVYIGSAFFEDDYIENGEVPYEDFTVWDLSELEDSGPSTDRGDEMETPTEPADDNTGRGDELNTPTEEATATDVPTDTPEPTETSEPTETPEPTATEAPTETIATPKSDASPVAEAGTYTDPRSGITLSYDDSWTVVQEATVNGVPTLLLDNGTSTLQFQTIPLAADRPLSGAVDDAIAAIAEQDGVISAEVATDLDGEPIRSNGVRQSSALVAVIVEDESGDEVEYRYYIEVRNITNQPDGLLIIHAAPADEYADQIIERGKVVTTIVYPVR